MRHISVLSIAILIGLTACSPQIGRVTTRRNRAASLSSALPKDPLQWRVITTSVDHREFTMSTLFGNDAAVNYVRSNRSHDYPVGAELSLVTWKQQEDLRWFGARIPADPESVEFVAVGTDSKHGTWYSYQNFEGSPLTMVATEQGPVPNERAAYLLSQRAAVLP